jgi:hypothetical protein
MAKLTSYSTRRQPHQGRNDRNCNKQTREKSLAKLQANSLATR